jgi:hypothetical protein
MRDDSDDDFIGVQDVGEDVGVQVDESEQAEFFEALLHCHSGSSMFLRKGMEAMKNAAIKHLYDESKSCSNEFTILKFVLQFLVIKDRFSWRGACSLPLNWH